MLRVPYSRTFQRTCTRRSALVIRHVQMSATAVAAPVDTDAFIAKMNDAYEKVHKEYEDNFWSTKMALKGASTEALARTKTAYEAFLGDAANLTAVRQLLAEGSPSPEQAKVLAIMEKTFKCYITEDPRAKELKERLNTLEAELSGARNTMALGYKDPEAEGAFVKASSVVLRDKMRVSDAEATRKACWEGLRGIGPFVAQRFLDIVKARNQLARLLGYQDFYDYKVTSAEGFGKTRLFEIMDDLERRSRPIMEAARSKLAAEKGAAALEPWNIGYSLAGDTEKALDPYFPFEDAVDVWARTFAALGIHYRGSTMRLDLCDREGKYSNGFCHWPQPAWKRADGSWVAAQTNFTSLATPSQVGSGKTALVTLLHEGGHAAHFANIVQRSPFFSQERAPTSVAYAENQSMFLDAFAGDAAWLARYARSREGQPVPMSVIEAHKRATQPYEVFALRGMLAVPYFEKALYEMPEDQLTVEALIQLADKVEQDIQGGLAGRPLLSVPHILADEASCYYHGYVLAEMSVHQTRAYFDAKLGGKLVDNPQVGKELAEVYWAPGNGAAFLDLVQQLTGTPLAADAWIKHLEQPLEQLLEQERAAYAEAVAAGPRLKPGEEPDIGMRVLLVHGDEVIADSADAGLAAAVAKFKAWVRATFFSTETAAAT
ncbi:oligoendopeptidase [Haematococcus lacustris]